MKYYTNKARQAGMTLIELTVVLLVLIGLAGLMIPYVSGFVSKTHDSVNSDSLAAVNGAIQRYDVQFMGQPNGYESLMSTVDTSGAGAIYTKMMGGTGTNDYLKTVSVQGSALAGVGIDTLREMNDSTGDATFAASDATITITNDSDLYTLAALNVKGSDCGMSDAMGCIKDDAALAKILGRSASTIDTSANDYLVFGIGSDSGMVGKTMSEAPVHFAKTGAMSAANKYNRILAVYSVSKTGVQCTLNGMGATQYWDGAVQTIADQAACEAITTSEFLVNPDSAGDGSNVAGAGVSVSSVNWNGTGMQSVKFVTTAMPMMKLEGLGGALASHYGSLDN